MDVLTALMSRRSIRKFTGESVSRDMVMQLLRAGMQAPSARNRQSWVFFIEERRKRLIKLSSIHPYGRMLAMAGVAILVCGDRMREESLIYQVQNCSAATQNVLLAAHGLGLGAVWLGIQPREERIAAMARFFALPDHLVPVSLVAVGIPAERPSAQDRFREEAVVFPDDLGQ